MGANGHASTTPVWVKAVGKRGRASGQLLATRPLPLTGRWFHPWDTDGSLVLLLVELRKLFSCERPTKTHEELANQRLETPMTLRWTQVWTEVLDIFLKVSLQQWSVKALDPSSSTGTWQAKASSYHLPTGLAMNHRNVWANIQDPPSSLYLHIACLVFWHTVFVISLQMKCCQPNYDLRLSIQKDRGAKVWLNPSATLAASWWLNQPIWKNVLICLSNWIQSSQVGVNILKIKMFETTT